MLRYDFRADVLQISEKNNGNDVEFQIAILKEDPFLLQGMKRIQHHFEDNEVHTDVLFYAYPNREYRMIVRREYYEDFIVELFRHRLLEKVEWLVEK